VQGRLFPEQDFDLLLRTSSFKENAERFSLHSLNPDFKFLDKKSSKQFYVECKYRNMEDEKSAIQWAKPFQMERYRQVEEEESCPVFICMGISGNPTRPEKVYLIPLKELQSLIIRPSQLDKYNLKYTPLLSGYLTKLLTGHDA
jgi:hypothetical protein